MKTAEQIMKEKTYVKAEMDKVLPKECSDELWQEATEKLQDILNRYPDLPKGVRVHTDSRIFPSAAVYLTVKEELGSERAYKILEDASTANCAIIRAKMEKLMKLPGMPGLFIRIWDPLTKKMFGPDNGFANVFYPKQKGEYRMDVTFCPYNRYFAELGCPELTPIWCDNDNRIYGDLPGICFERSGTLGKGADHCDFHVRRAR